MDLARHCEPSEAIQEPQRKASVRVGKAIACPPSSNGAHEMVGTVQARLCPPHRKQADLNCISYRELSFAGDLRYLFERRRERSLIRGAAYSALCRSEKMEWRDMLPAPRVFDSSTEIDREVLKRVKQKLRRHTH